MYIDEFDDYRGPFDVPFECPYRQFFQPGQQGSSSMRPPTAPPPSKVPLKQEVQVKAIDPGAIRRCKYRLVYIWLDNGRDFWAWLTFVGPRSIAGYRWNGRRWVYFGIDTRRIDSFVCR